MYSLLISPSAPSEVFAWAPSVVTGMIPGVLMRVVRLCTLRAFRIAAGVVGVLDVWWVSSLFVRVSVAWHPKMSVSFFNASICRPGCCVAVFAMRRNACVRACARRLYCHSPPLVVTYCVAGRNLPCRRCGIRPLMGRRIPSIGSGAMLGLCTTHSMHVAPMMVLFLVH